MNDHSGHWFNHQGTDLFLPEVAVERILDVAGIIYEIGTRKGVQIEGTRKWHAVIPIKIFQS